MECLITADIEDEEDVDEDDVKGQANSQCGAASIEFKPSLPIAKVAGGQTASPGSQPWTASIRVRGNTRTFHWCGAVLVSQYHLLTAGHCVEVRSLTHIPSSSDTNYFFLGLSQRILSCQGRRLGPGCGRC